MCATAVEGLDALFLVHTEGGTQKASVVEVVDVGNAYVTVQELAYIAAELHLAAILQ